MITRRNTLKSIQAKAEESLNVIEDLLEIERIIESERFKT